MYLFEQFYLKNSIILCWGGRAHVRARGQLSGSQDSLLSFSVLHILG